MEANKLAELFNQSKNVLLVSDLDIAKSIWQRGRGLLGKNNLADHEALWISFGISIHTFFMRFSIDCVFMDKNKKVRALYKNIPPWRIVGPVWGAWSVIEMPAGKIDNLKIEIGDQLHVVS